MTKNFLSMVNNIMKHFVSVLENKTLLAFLLIAGIGALWFGISSKQVDPIEKTNLTRGPITQIVKVTGKVKAGEEANLAFQSGGTVSYIGVSIGDTVNQGTVLATLASDDEQANVLQAKATLENAEAVLAQLTQGSRKEEIAIKQQVVESAKNTVQTTYATLPDAIRNVDAVTADAIKNKIAPMFIFAGDRYKLSFSSCDQRLQSAVEASRSTLEDTLAAFQKSSTAVTSLSQASVIDAAFNQAYLATISANDLITDISTLLLAPCSAQNTSLDTYRASLTLARTSMNTVFADISAKRTALTVAKNTLAGAERDLALTEAGTDITKIKAQQALVSQAQASVAQAQARLNKTIVRAPFTGVITNVSLIRGESATLAKTVISMISKTAFEVEASIPEIDIAKIALTNKVDITLDAYGNGVIFPATITRINPSAVFEGNVPKYNVIATFLKDDTRIKTGMTANVSIVTQNVKSAFTLPIRFVTVLDETRGTVTVEDGKITKEVPVVLGIRGEDGLIEIISGLTESETVLAIQPGVRAAQKQSE